MLQFPYLDEPLTGPPPPSLSSISTARYRPLIPITIVGPTGQRKFSRAVVDSGGDDTVFPFDVLKLIGVTPRPDTGHRVRWRGNLHPLRFAEVELVLSDNSSTYRWRAVLAFSPAPFPYPILGNAGCLQFFNVRLLGADLMIEIETNWKYLGTKQ
jgi:hypothetical protein